MRKCTIVLALAVCALGSASAIAEMATFDFFPEGFIGANFADGGIAFFDLDNRLDPNPWFAIEWASATLSGPDFSPPNVLAWTMIYNGPNTGFWRCGSFKFKTPDIETFASLELFDMSNVGGNTVTLQAFLNGALVNSSSITLLPPPGIHHYTLSVSGVPFDTLRLIGTGPNHQGCFFGVVDNVVVTPEPLAGLGLLLAIALRRRR